MESEKRIAYILILVGLLLIDGCAQTLNKTDNDEQSKGLFSCQQTSDCIPLWEYFEGDGKTQLSNEARSLSSTLDDICVNKEKTSIIQDANYLQQVLGCSIDKAGGSGCNLNTGYVPRGLERFEVCRCKANICETQMCNKYGCQWMNIEKQLPAQSGP